MKATTKADSALSALFLETYLVVARKPAGARVASSLLSPSEWLCLIKMICRVLSLTLTYSRLWRDFRFFPFPQKRGRRRKFKNLFLCSHLV